MSGATVGQLVDAAAEKWPHQDALFSVQQETRFSFQTVRDKANLQAHFYLKINQSYFENL